MDYEGSYKVRRRPRYYLFLLIIIPLVTGIVLLLRNGDDKKTELGKTEKLTALDFRNKSVQLQDFLNGKFYARGFNGTFFDEKTMQYFSAAGDFMTFSMDTGLAQIVVSSQEFFVKIGHRPFRCDFSPSKKFLLISYDPQKIYRHSTFALYDVFDLATRQTTQIKILQDSQESSRRIQLAKWSTKQDSLVFVHSNDIYFLKNIHGNAERVTFNGNHLIYNGVADWVYEEEMFSSNEAVWLHDDTHLAFVTFNDTFVDLIHFSVYDKFQYPVVEAIPYPKTGTQNPTATVSIHSNGVTRALKLPSFIPDDHLIGQVKWTEEKKLIVQIFNRCQNNAWILLCDFDNCDVIHTQESQGWLDMTPIFQTGEKTFVTMESTKQGKFSYKHLIEFSTSSVVKVVTRGDFNVDKILAVAKGEIYYMAKKNLYKDKKCLTCGFKCEANDVVMSTSGQYFVHTCLNGIDQVPVVSIFESDPLELVMILESNEGLKKSLKTVAMPTTKLLKFTTEDGFQVNMKLLLPHDFDEESKYPLLIDVYGGPGSNRINSRFQVDWGVSMVSSKNVIYGMIDGRGSGGQSDEFLFSVYKRFGTVEVLDQILGVKSLLKTEKYIDPKKVAIWGWSYGGYVSAMVMGLDTENIFKCGISVAPVTNWAYYDTIYTERYMCLPPSPSYNNSDITMHLSNFKFKKYLLVHGNADDNVHYQQSMYLARALELGDILFFQQSYPDENHGLSSVRPHLYHTLQRFLFEECF